MVLLKAKKSLPQTSMTKYHYIAGWWVSKSFWKEKIGLGNN